jgi:hypothetical protein
MSPSDEISGIADASRPNAGRIYDYLLGGNHNFEIDRQAAQRVLEIGPFFPQMFRVLRWFLGEAIRRLCDEGFRKFLDFASGLPTMDHIHEVAPKGTKVLYSDIDPVTVAYAHQITGDNPDIQCLQCDAGQPEKLLESQAVEELFGKDRKLAIGFNGVAWFLEDKILSHSLKTIYDWADKGAKLFMSDHDAVPSERGRQMIKLYENLQKLHIRRLDLVKELIGPWTICEPGFMPLEDWVGMEHRVTEEMTELFGGHMIGAILEKK